MSGIIECLQQADEAVFLALNGAQCAYADSVMWLFSGRWAYMLPVLALLYVAYRSGWKRGLMIVLAVALTVVLSDQIASSLIKPLVCRLRPSHAEHLCAYILNGRRGGMYGFVSSHAANSFGVAVLFILLSRHRLVAISMLLWAALVSYSRIYLGVHYPGDIICGALVGVAMAFLVNKLAERLPEPYRPASCFNECSSRLLAASVAINMVGIFAASVFYSV